MFTAKLNKAFTHSPIAVVESTSSETIRADPEDERLAKDGLDSIADENMLGAVLAQFPISFKNTNANRDYLETVVEKFKQYPLVVEVRHNSWTNEGTLRYFAEKGVAFCNIDQPRLGKAVAPSEHVTAAFAYVRLHGRNYDQWFDSDSRNDRYNYLYTDPELQGWKTRIDTIAAKAQEDLCHRQQSLRRQSGGQRAAVETHADRTRGRRSRHAVEEVLGTGRDRVAGARRQSQTSG